MRRTACRRQQPQAARPLVAPPGRWQGGFFGAGAARTGGTFQIESFAGTDEMTFGAIGAFHGARP